LIDSRYVGGVKISAPRGLKVELVRSVSK
jgi:hypothetical protein